LGVSFQLLSGKRVFLLVKKTISFHGKGNTFLPGRNPTLVIRYNVGRLDFSD